MWVPSSGVKMSKKNISTFEDGTHMLLRNAGNKLPIDAAQNPRKLETSATPKRKPEKSQL